ncbi:MAG: CxxxxCH/CxxCH domain-containing protein [bacterium]|nr:CxxxxCH/CxxCH domain-containing protein [bacterium]
MEPATSSAASASTVTATFTLAFISCSEDRVTESYDTHPSNWMDPFSPDWHGQAAIGSSGASCLDCHAISSASNSMNGEGASAATPTAGAACYDCHSYPHVADMNRSHAEHFRTLQNWSTVSNCRSCHGADFAGGRSGASCNECHTQQGGPAACNTCHGMPPTTTRPIGGYNPGVHAAHSRYACTECHARVNGLDHIDALPADVSFENARISNQHGYPVSYESLGGGNGTCATYCHSDLHSGPPRVAVAWAAGQTLTTCVSCHSVPPVSDFHPNNPRCHECHLNIDPEFELQQSERD